jgi:Uma2 family endonuclease
MIAQQDLKPRYTSNEYLELEVNAEHRHEYIDGEIFLMAGGLPNHNKVAGNIYASLLFLLKRQPYEVYITDQRLWIPRRRIYTYPDVMVVAQPIAYAEDRRDTLINPTFIAEVLSESTQDYDQGGKFAAYRTIPSFQEYLLLSQTSITAQHYVKEGDRRWTLTDYENPQDVIGLPSLNCELTLSDLYDKVELDRDSTIIESDSTPFQAE